MQEINREVTDLKGLSFMFGINIPNSCSPGFFVLKRIKF